MFKFAAFIALVAAASAQQTFQATSLSTDKVACSAPYVIDYTPTAACFSLPCTQGVMDSCVNGLPPLTSGQFGIITYTPGSTGCSANVTTAVYHPLGVCGGATANTYTLYKYNAGDSSVQQFALCESTCTTCALNTKIPLGCQGGYVQYAVGSA